MNYVFLCSQKHFDQMLKGNKLVLLEVILENSIVLDDNSKFLEFRNWCMHIVLKTANKTTHDVVENQL